MKTLKKIKIYTDGGARGNPGPAGCGVVIYDSQNKKIKEINKYIGRATNNQAEYNALILGLQKAKELKVEEVDCFLDSQLVVEQLNHNYKIKNPDLGSLFIKVWNLSQFFKKISFSHIPREKNKEADNLVNEAIDSNKKKDLNR